MEFFQQQYFDKLQGRRLLRFRFLVGVLKVYGRAMDGVRGFRSQQ